MTSICSDVIAQPENDDTRNGNWIAISRDMPEHWLVGFGQQVKASDAKRGAYSRAEAWIDLLMLARWKPGVEANKGRRTFIDKGQFLGGYTFLSERWNWTVKTVRNFIAKLIEESMISKEVQKSTANGKASLENEAKKGTQSHNQIQKLTICNYRKYQVASELDELLKGQARGKRGASEGQDLNKETIHTDNSACAHDFPEGDFVKVNGEAIYVALKGKRLKFEYCAIDQWAALNLCPQDKARQIVEAEARGWLADQQWPQAPSRWLQKQLQNWRVHKAIAETRIENAAKPYAGRASFGGHRKPRDVNEMTAAEYEAYLERGNV